MLILENYSDNQLPQLPQHQVAKGGTGILSQQAICPFQAAASFRLQASEPEEIIDGISPMDKGSQVHKILEHVWKQLQTQQNLLKLDDPALQQIVQQAIDQVMTYYQHQRPDLYQPNFLSLEKQRLLRLTLNWLEVDKQRLQPFRVIEIEQEKTLEIGNLVFKTRVDRIDQLDNGQRILLDYKTGHSATSNSWLKEQITEPQLPLYSLNESDDLAALALAKVTEKQCGFSGLAKDNGLLPGIKAFAFPVDMQTDDRPSDWSRLQQLWKERLTLLAESYRKGDASLEPDNCQYCRYAALCRKHAIEEKVT